MSLYSFLMYVLCIVWLFGTAASQMYGNMSRLKSHLLTGYQSDILPRDTQEPVYINFSSHFFLNLETDEMKNTASFMIGLLLSWTDINLKWNTDDFNGIEEIYIKQTDIWAPKILITSSTTLAVINNSEKLLKIRNDGNVTVMYAQTVELFCEYNMQYWPFDSAICFVGFMVEDYDDKAVHLISKQNSPVLNRLSSPAWNFELINRNSQYDSFCIRLTRQSAFPLSSIIFPTVCLLLINPFVFLVPQESGEKISFSLTLMLATAVFLTIISDEIPKASDPVPLICTFLLTAVVECVVIIGLVILNMRIFYRKPDSKVGQGFRLLVKLSRLNCLACCNNSKKYTSNEAVNEEGHAKGQSFSPVGIKENGQTRRSVNLITETDDEGKRDVIYTWMDVSRALDTILFVVCFSVSLTGSIASLYYLKMSAESEPPTQYCWTDK